MTDRRAATDPDETPEDVASLYSWANLHGAKYRDFSASRAQWRAMARERAQGAMEAERRRALEASGAYAVEAEREALAAARENAERAERAQLAAQQGGRQGAHGAHHLVDARRVQLDVEDVNVGEPLERTPFPP